MSYNTIIQAMQIVHQTMKEKSGRKDPSIILEVMALEELIEELTEELQDDDMI